MGKTRLINGISYQICFRCLKTGSYDLKVQLCDQMYGSSAENKKVLNKENQSDQLDMTESGFGQLDGSDSDHGQQEEEYPNPQHIRKVSHF